MSDIVLTLRSPGGCRACRRGRIGRADFAEEFAGDFHRIEAVAEVDGTMRVLDLTESAVRSAVRSADDAVALYRGATAY